MSVLFLFFKMHANSVIQAYYRTTRRVYARPEDGQLPGLKGGEEAKEDLPEVRRTAAMWGNDLDNVPLFILVALALTLLRGPAQWGALYFGVFCLARLLHAVFYFKLVQPHRFFAYQTGLISRAALAVHTAVLMV